MLTRLRCKKLLMNERGLSFSRNPDCCDDYVAD